MPDNEADYLGKMSELVAQSITSSSQEERRDWGIIKEKVRIDLKRFISRGTGRRPMIIPVILEV